MTQWKQKVITSNRLCHCTSGNLLLSPESSSFFYLIRVIPLYITNFFVRIYYLTTKNNPFLLPLLRISLFVYISCPPWWRDCWIQIFLLKLMTSGRTENIQHILKSCSVHLKDLASYVSRISDVTNFAMIILKNIFTNVNLNMIKWKILFSVQDKVFPTASKQSFDCVIIDSWYLIQNTLANRFSQNG